MNLTSDGKLLHPLSQISVLPCFCSSSSYT